MISFITAYFSYGSWQLSKENLHIREVDNISDTSYHGGCCFDFPGIHLESAIQIINSSTNGISIIGCEALGRNVRGFQLYRRCYFFRHALSKDKISKNEPIFIPPGKSEVYKVGIAFALKPNADSIFQNCWKIKEPLKSGQVQSTNNVQDFSKNQTHSVFIDAVFDCMNETLTSKNEYTKHFPIGDYFGITTDLIRLKRFTDENNKISPIYGIELVFETGRGNRFKNHLQFMSITPKTMDSETIFRVGLPSKY